MKYFIKYNFRGIKLFLFLIVASLLNSGCQKFLSTTPADKFSEEEFWNSSEQFEAGLVGIYTVLRGYPASWIFYSDILTPNAVKFDDPGGWRSIARGSALTTNVLFETAWETDYKGVGRANNVLGNLKKADLTADESKKIEGEAKFLRAYFYFDLLNKFGEVPLITDPPSSSQEDLTRSPKQDILDLILNDLTDASNLLLVDGDPGRVTKGAALALKARVLLYNERWDEAANTAAAVMGLRKYSLFPNYGDLFKQQNENNQEVIWDIEFLLPRFSNNFVDDAVVHTSPAPLKELIDDYYMTDGKPAESSSLFDKSNPYANRDPRLYQTVRLIGSMFNGAVTVESDVPETFIGAKKWIPYDDDTHMQPIPSGQSQINPIVIRYGEVLLIYAEARNEASGPVDSVYDAMNEIRNRPNVNMPQVTPGLNKDEMRKIIRHERRIELAMEGYYYYDIRRWNIVNEVMNGPVHNFFGSIYEQRTFVDPKDRLFSIPVSQSDLNPNLLPNNPGW